MKLSNEHVDIHAAQPPSAVGLFGTALAGGHFPLPVEPCTIFHDTITCQAQDRSKKRNSV